MVEIVDNSGFEDLGFHPPGGSDQDQHGASRGSECGSQSCDRITARRAQGFCVHLPGSSHAQVAQQRLEAGLPNEKGIRKGVHNLRHTFGRRPRSAGVPVEIRKILRGHANGDITTHYSAAEIEELRQAVQRIVNPRVVQAPTLMIVRKSRIGVGKVSANEKGIAQDAV